MCLSVPANDVGTVMKSRKKYPENHKDTNTKKIFLCG